MQPQLFENEKIKLIENYENYGITTKGRVWSYRNSKWLKPTINTRGNYKREYVSLGRGNKFYVHRLVALAFIPNPNDLPEVDHIDANGLNNNVENLRWVSHVENMRNEETLKKTKNNTGYFAEIVELETGEIFVGVHEIIEKYGVCKTTVYKHLNNKVVNPRWAKTGKRIRPSQKILE